VAGGRNMKGRYEENRAAHANLTKRRNIRITTPVLVGCWETYTIPESPCPPSAF